MKNKKKLPAIVTTLILTVITSIFWVFFTAYRSVTSKPQPAVPAEIILPLNPKLDTNTIEEIKNKSFLETIPDDRIDPVVETPISTQSAITEPVSSPEPLP